MTGGTVATDSEGSADGRADQGAGSGIMTTGAGVMGFGRCADQGVIVTVCTVGRTDGDESLVWSLTVGCSSSQVPL